MRTDYNGTWRDDREQLVEMVETLVWNAWHLAMTETQREQLVEMVETLVWNAWHLAQMNAAASARQVDADHARVWRELEAVKDRIRG